MATLNDVYDILIKRGEKLNEIIKLLKESNQSAIETRNELTEIRRFIEEYRKT